MRCLGTALSGCVLINVLLYSTALAMFWVWFVLVLVLAFFVGFAGDVLQDVGSLGLGNLARCLPFSLQRAVTFRLVLCLLHR